MAGDGAPCATSRYRAAGPSGACRARWRPKLSRIDDRALQPPLPTRRLARAGGDALARTGAVDLACAGRQPRRRGVCRGLHILGHPVRCHVGESWRGRARFARGAGRRDPERGWRDRRDARPPRAMPAVRARADRRPYRPVGQGRLSGRSWPVRPARPARSTAPGSHRTRRAATRPTRAARLNPRRPRRWRSPGRVASTREPCTDRPRVLQNPPRIAISPRAPQKDRP